jgi:hypothetical protein
MKRAFLALAVALLLLLVAGVGTAAANPHALQDAGQTAGSDQDAGAAAGAAQQEPSNENGPVDVLSKGDDGDVSQTNEASSNATAGNANLTFQNADQAQGGATEEPVADDLKPQDAKHSDSCKCGDGGSQVIGQSAENEQDAAALAVTEQEKPSNSNTAVRVLSPGDAGDVSQTNEASSDASAGNLNLTGQDADQAQAGGSGQQEIGQSAKNDQDAAALALTEQEKPSNSNISVRVLSPGDDGDVTQTNEASSDASAGNLNLTGQDAEQTQAGGSGLQVIGQEAKSDQDAAALAATKQEKPSNSNISVRVLSPGDSGSVEQSNIASSEATAANVNLTGQKADQTQAGDSCKCGSGIQAIGQSAKNDQDAAALAATKQEKPSNSNISVRVLSKGDDGDVSQTNEAASDAFAGNLNLTGQHASQEQAGDSCKCGSGIQAIGQSAKSEQEAAAISATIQEKPSNENTPVRVLSKGDDGDVSQTNEASSDAFAGNLNLTGQHASQEQAGGSGIQVIGQEAKNDQDAFALGSTVQKGASNENAPVRVLSKGDGGDVTQSNVASSGAFAGNANLTGQKADQTQAGDSCKCGSGIQAIGQSAKSEQEAAAISATIQEKPSNSNTPVRVLGKGDDGDVSQTNEASSDAFAGNLNLTGQHASQEQAGGSGIQVIGQSAKSEQGAFALGLTVQKGAENENTPIRVLSKGDSGSVDQANVASSDATAANINLTGQKADQTQAGDSCKCGGGLQVIGQSSKNHQGAVALAATVQLGLEHPCKCKDGSFGNSNEPTRVLSKGDDGDVRQANVATSDAKAVNLNATKQAASQIQSASCRCKKDGDGVQVIGQKADSSQFALGLAFTLQLDPSNSSKPDREKSPGKHHPVKQKGMEAAHDGSLSSIGTDQSRNQVER